MESRCIFDTLLLAIQSPQGIKPLVLKSLYFLLVRLTRNPQWGAACGLDLDELEMEIDHGGMKVKFGVIRKLSDVLFKELSEQIDRLFFSLDKSHISKDFNMGIDAETLLLLLRCCLVILIQLVTQQKLLQEKGQVLMTTFQKLCSFNLARKTHKNGLNFEKSVSRAQNHYNDCCTTSFTEDFVASLEFLEPTDPHLSLLSSIVEVFVDEMAIHGELREYFKLIDTASSTREKLFVPHFGQCAIGVLVEVIGCHFTLLFSDQRAFQDAVNRLFWVKGEEFKHSFRAPEVSLLSAASLLHNPVVLSAPKLVLAHVVSLVSEACSSIVDLDSFKMNHRLTDNLLSVFEKSVILYQNFMSSLHIQGNSASSRTSCARANIDEQKYQLSFESYLSPVTKDKINEFTRMLDDSPGSLLQNIIVDSKSEMVNSSVRYVKNSRNSMDILFQDEILSILSNLILIASDGFDDTTVHLIRDASLQDVYLLSSLLKLIGTSLLSVIFCLRGNNFGCSRTLKDFPSCKEYNFMSQTISCFEEFSIRFPTQQQFPDIMKTFSIEHKASRMIFIHFSGLLSLAFVSGLECLVKGCLLTIMAAVNLFLFEEGNLDAFEPLVACNSENLSTASNLVKVHESVVDQNSSLVVASKFQKIRALCPSLKNSQPSNFVRIGDGYAQASASIKVPDSVEGIMDTEELTEETTNGEIFLKCMLQDKEISDFDDLADFIECKKGKSYSSWLKERQRYRNWKGEKMAVVRWKRKKKTWKLIAGKKN